MSGKAFINMRPQIVQAFFCLALQKSFIGHPNYPWSPDRRVSSLIIQTDGAENSKEANMHPSIIIEQGNLRFNNDSIGNRAYIERHKEYLAKEILQFTVSGSIVCHALTEARLASDNLAYEVATFFSMAHNTMIKTLQLQHLSMPQQSRARAISQREGADTVYDSSVMVEYAYAVRLEITPLDLGPLLDDVLFQANTPTPILGGGGVGGTNTGGDTGNWGGTGGVPAGGGQPSPGGGDYIDDGLVELNFSTKDP